MLTYARAFDVRFEETLGLSHDLNQLVHEMRLRINASLAPLGLTTPKYAALSVLEARGAATNAELARECAVTAQTMNRIMKDLETAGFVTRLGGAALGLKQPFELTPKALAAVCAAHVAVNDVELAMVQGWAGEAVEQLQGALRLCHDNLRRMPQLPASAKEEDEG